MKSPFLNLKTDVLVIGGGFAGMWAARQARNHVQNVLILDKGPRDWGGMGSMCGGDIIVKFPEDDLNAMLRELVYYYDGLVEQDTMEEILYQSHDRFQDYLSFGHKFFQDEQGRYMPIPQRGLKNMRSYLSYPLGSGGSSLRAELVNEIERLGVQRMGNIYITEIVIENGKAIGAAGFHALNGQPLFCRAGAVVLAANMGGWKTSYHMNSCAGDAVPLAFAAGLPLRNFEFIRVWNTPKLFAWEGQTNLLPKGARFVNVLNEDFMSTYAPGLGAKGDPHYNVRGMACEAKAGRSPIYFDTSPMSEKDKLLMRPKAGWAKLHDEKLLAEGIDFFAGKHEWMPQVLTSFGGVMCGTGGSTDIAGLYVAGRSRGIDGGVYMGGLSMCLVATTGHMAGENAGAWAAEHCVVESSSHGEESAQAAVKNLGKEGIAPKDIVRRIQEIISAVDVCILKTETGLLRGMAALEKLKQNDLPRMGTPDPHYLVKAREAMAMLMLTEFTLKASLMRSESRAGHHREDFPLRDNDQWLKWIIITNEAGEPHLSTTPVPLEKYKITPLNCYMDKFDFSSSHPK